jgi:hypothetical protein
MIHNQHIKDIVPEEKLLVIRISDRWEPLCRFLDKPVPNDPFPRGNDRAQVAKIGSRIMLKLAIRWVVVLTTVTTIPYIAYRTYYQTWD